MSTDTYQGYALNKASSRVSQPPGGKSSNIFGDPAPAPARKAAPPAAAPAPEPVPEPVAAPEPVPEPAAAPQPAAAVRDGTTMGTAQDDRPSVRVRQPPGGKSSGIF